MNWRADSLLGLTFIFMLGQPARSLEIAHEVTIHAPVAEVFTIATQPQYWPLWYPYSYSTEPLTPQQRSTGAKFTETIHLISGIKKIYWKVDAFEENRLWQVRGLSTKLNVLLTYTFEKIDNNTTRFKRRMAFRNRYAKLLTQTFSVATNDKALFALSQFKRLVESRLTHSTFPEIGSWHSDCLAGPLKYSSRMSATFLEIDGESNYVVAVELFQDQNCTQPGLIAHSQGEWRTGQSTADWTKFLFIPDQAYVTVLDGGFMQKLKQSQYCDISEWVEQKTTPLTNSVCLGMHTPRLRKVMYGEFQLSKSGLLFKDFPFFGNAWLPLVAYTK